MKASPISIPRRPTSERGVALVLTLAIIVIATVVATAFFFRSRYDVQGTGSYSSQVTARKLADLGAAQVTSGFLAETVAGSDQILGPGTEHQKLLVKPESAQFMVPQKTASGGSLRLMAPSSPANLASDPYLSVVRQSVENLSGATINGQDISGGIQVSDIRTSANAVNREGLNGKFWGKPMLTNDGPDSFANANVPSWVYVTADGSTVKAPPENAKSSDPNYVVGRYAFNVYDVGGLLDANVAGFTPTGGANLAGRKGSLIFADLAQLANRVGVGLGAADIATLNTWRYPAMDWNASDQIPSDRLNMLMKSGGMLASVGKFTPGMSGGIGRQNANTFFSRQDMIQYFAGVLDGGNPDMPHTRQLLPYLTHFSRDINQPTYQWDWDSRPKVSNVLYNSVGTSPTKHQSINSEAWDRNTGETKMPRRFPLERLDLLRMKSDGNPEGDPGLIRRYFGLVWDASAEDGHKRWVYDPIEGGNTKIRSLEDVNGAALDAPGMEPNFFEVLSAAINAATLGQQFGGVTLTIDGKPNQPHCRLTPNSQLQFDGQVDSHVMRIGAAIIDQWDSDSYPTEIVFNKRTIFGVEDLPYLHGFKRMNYYGVTGPYTLQFNSSWTSKGGKSSMSVVEGATLMHPQVWNPHSPSSGKPTAGPTQFRVIPYVDTLEGLSSNNPKTDQPKMVIGSDFGRNPRVVDIGDLNGSLRYDLYVSSSNPAVPGGLNWTTALPPMSGSDFVQFTGSPDQFREPVLLWKPTSTNVLNTVSVPVEVSGVGSSAQQFVAKWLTYIEPGASPTKTDTFVGFRMGKFLVENIFNLSTGGNTGMSQIDWVLGSDTLASQSRVNFALQYNGPHGWQTYDIMYDTVDLPDANSDGTKVWRCVGFEHDATYRVDPRVERFGPQSQFYRATAYPMNSLYNFPPGVTGWRLTGNPPTWLFYWAGGGDNGLNCYNAQTTGTGLAALWKNLKSSGSATNNNNNWENLTKNLEGGVRYLDPDQWARGASGADLSGGEIPSVQQNSSSRPIVLNRRFQSVAEMGYACRDLPWKSVDFWNSNSGDVALLDYFCLYETESDPTASQMTAGALNINTANPLVLASLIAGGSVKPDGTDHISFADAEDIANELSIWTHSAALSAGPLRSRADIVGAWKGSYVGPFTGEAVQNAGTFGDVQNSSAIRAAVKKIENADVYEALRTNLMRALVDATTVRTWNLMIDVVAQSGKIRPNGDLEDFVVDGQVRNWVFVSIDRLTGKIVDMKTESAD